MTKIQAHNGEYLTESLEELLDEISISIANRFPGCKVILFGSYAKGERNKDSDIDICVLVPELTGKRLEMSVSARGCIRDDFPLPIDILLYTFDEFDTRSRHNSTLQSTIKREGVVLND